MEEKQHPRSNINTIYQMHTNKRNRPLKSQGGFFICRTGQLVRICKEFIFQDQSCVYKSIRKIKEIAEIIILL